MKCKDCANANSCASVAEQNGTPLDLDKEQNCRFYEGVFLSKRTYGVQRKRTTGIHEKAFTEEDYV